MLSSATTFFFNKLRVMCTSRSVIQSKKLSVLKLKHAFSHANHLWCPFSTLSHVPILFSAMSSTCNSFAILYLLESRQITPKNFVTSFLSHSCSWFFVSTYLELLVLVFKFFLSEKKKSSSSLSLKWPL